LAGDITQAPISPTTTQIQVSPPIENLAIFWPRTNTEGTGYVAQLVTKELDKQLFVENPPK
jgi:hypothetical protein